MIADQHAGVARLGDVVHPVALHREVIAVEGTDEGEDVGQVML